MRTNKAIEEFLEDCEARDLRPRSRTHYRWALRRLAANCPILPRRGRDLRPVFTGDHLSNKSKVNLDKVLRNFFRWCQREYRHPNPMLERDRVPERRTLPRILTTLELEALCGVAESRRDQALIAVPMDNGIRLGEILSLRWPDVGPDYLVVRGKRGDRQVPLSRKTRLMLLGLGDGYHLWVGRQGPLSWSGLQQIYFRLFDLAALGGRKHGPHTLRHTFATRYIDNGGNVRKLQAILGHSDLKMTMVYVHLAGLDVKSDHARFSPIHNLPLGEKYA